MSHRLASATRRGGQENIGRTNFSKNSANHLDDQTSELRTFEGSAADALWVAFPKAFAGKGLRWYSSRLVGSLPHQCRFPIFVFSLIARTSAGRIEMRSLINAMNRVVVNGLQDRTNVAGIGSLRGLDLPLSSCIYAGRVLHAAYLSGWKSIKPAHQRTLMAEPRRFATAEAPCWHPAQSITGSPAYAWTT
jgi:hypothetical protein